MEAYTPIIVVLSLFAVGTPAAPAFTDYDNDGIEDIAFHQPGGQWNTLPVLYNPRRDLSDPRWVWTNASVPSWANQAGTIAIPGDFDGDGWDDDIAFHKPGGQWDTVPVLFGNGDGTWASQNRAAPAWANRHGAVAIAGHYDGDGRADIAFFQPGDPDGGLHVLLSVGNGAWDHYSAFDETLQSLIRDLRVKAVPGDYDGDDFSDILFHVPGSWSNALSVAYGAVGRWSVTTRSVPNWGSQFGAVAIPGDFDGNGRDDVAFHRPGSHWNTVPVLRSAGYRGWVYSNDPAPDEANYVNAVAIAGHFDVDGRTDIAIHLPGTLYPRIPMLLSSNQGWRIVEDSRTAVLNSVNRSEVIAIPLQWSLPAGQEAGALAFHRPGSRWTSVPYAESASGRWSDINLEAPDWTNQLGVVGIR